MKNKVKRKYQLTVEEEALHLIVEENLAPLMVEKEVADKFYYDYCKTKYISKTTKEVQDANINKKVW